MTPKLLPTPAPQENDCVSNGALTKKSRESERRRRRRRRKQKKNKASAGDGDKEDADPQQVMEKVEVEYIPEKPGLEDDGLDDEFRKIFERFMSFGETALSEETEDKKEEEEEDAQAATDEEQNNDQREEGGGISNKKRKLQRRMKIGELKQICSRPDVVEIWDASSADPKLLVFLKSYRNTVPVPRHWSQKRNKFLQGRRGIEKQPFRLPDFVAATGIERIRQAYIEKEDSKKPKQKQRERMLQPKMGRMDIDYQVLHDAFFKYQTKPKLTSHGDLYFEGKEFELVKLRQMKPGGMLSRELKEALGMLEGAPPPPWLINMQRHGPPPSYPQLKIPGLNAWPIPAAASFGYLPGRQDQPNYEEEPIDKSKHWGDLEEEIEEEEEELEEEDIDESGIESVDSLSSTPTGVETPDIIDLRKGVDRPALYTVLEEKEENAVALGTLLGTTHTYHVVNTGARDKAGAKRVDLLRGQKADRVDVVTLLPEELDSMDNVLPAKYEESREEEKLRSQREDFSDMVAENEKKRKRKKMQEKDGKSKKKHFFKF